MNDEVLRIVRAAVAAPDPALRPVRVRVERTTIVKRRWRGTAEDGREFGCDLEAPLKDGDTLCEASGVRYVIEQIPEAVLEVSLAITPSAAAGIGWAIGNLHLELQAEPQRLLAADEPAVRQLLDRLNVPYRATTAVFRPGRFVRGTQQSSHELGPSHRH